MALRFWLLTRFEVGCGTGYWLREFIKWGAQPEHIVGVDLLSDRVTEAKKLCPETVQVQCGSAAALAFPSATFDLVLQSTVFTSVLDASMKQQMAAEMLRVVKSDGLILWYDYHVNNPWNADVRGIKRQEIAQLSRLPHEAAPDHSCAPAGPSPRSLLVARLLLARESPLALYTLSRCDSQRLKNNG